MFAKFKLETHMNTRFEISRKGFYCASTIDYTTVVHFFCERERRGQYWNGRSGASVEMATRGSS